MVASSRGRPRPSTARIGEPPRIAVLSRAALSWSRRSRITPSRSAHGQISSSGEVEEVHHGVGDERAGDHLVGPAGRDTGQLGDLVRRSSRASLGIHSSRSARGQDAAYEQALARTAPRRRSGPASGTSSRSRPRGPARPRAAGCRRRGRSAVRIVLAQLAASASSPGGPSAKCSRVSRPAPSGSDHATSGDLVGAAGDLERAAADVEDGQPARRPAEPAAYGEEGQPGLVLTGQHLDVDAGASCARRRARRRQLLGVADRRGGEAE